jgi:hypothetical protein
MHKGILRERTPDLMPAALLGLEGRKNEKKMYIQVAAVCRVGLIFDVGIFSTAAL